MSSDFPRDTTLASILEALARTEPARDDGVRHFHAVYTDVTLEVSRQLDAGGFEDPDFMIALDQIFAGLYLEAVRSPAAAPRAWKVVFDKRSDPAITPLQFALAGMNAHINRDLAVALDLACDQHGGSLTLDSARRRDFTRINDVLGAQMDEAKDRLFSTVGELIDAGLGELDDALELWSISAARNSAWTHGTLLHCLADSEARAAHLHTLDRTASLIGRLLLL